MKLIIFAIALGSSACAAAVKQSLSRAEVGYGVSKQLPVLQRCLEQHPADEMSFDDVVLTYAIEPDGRIEDVAIESVGPQTHEAFACMQDALSSYQFDPSEDGVSEVKLLVPVASR